MSGHDLGDVCRQIAAEHADQVAGVQAPVGFGADPLALIAGVDAYAEALQNLSAAVMDEADEESGR